MSNYPNFASFFLRQFSNVTHQNFLVEPQASGELEAHRQMQFTLPTNTNLLLPNTKLLFTMKGEDAGNTAKARLSAARSIIDRCEINFGGVVVSSGVAQQAVLMQCLANMKEEKEDPVDSHCDLYRRTNGINLEDIDQVSEAYSSANNTQLFSCDLAPFFSSIQPALFPLALAPSVTITLYLSANSTVVASPTGGSITTIKADGDAQATYKVNNYRLLVDAWSIDDGVFSSVLMTRLQSEGQLDAMFCDYEGFSDIYNGSTQVSSASSSLDKVICCWRPKEYSAKSGAIPLQGYNNTLAEGGAVNALDQPDTQGGNYLTKPLTFVVPSENLPSDGADNFTALPEISIAVNNIEFPSFSCKAGVQTYTLLKQAFEVQKTQSKSIAEYLENRFMVAYKFNLPQSRALRAKSGLNLQGSNSTIRIHNVGDTTNNATNFNCMTFLESTCVLSLGVGKQVSVSR